MRHDRRVALGIVLVLSLAACAPSAAEVTTAEGEVTTTEAADTATTAAPITTVPEETTTMADAGHSHGEGEPDPSDVVAGAFATAASRMWPQPKQQVMGPLWMLSAVSRAPSKGGMGLQYLDES